MSSRPEDPSSAGEGGSTIDPAPFQAALEALLEGLVLPPGASDRLADHAARVVACNERFNLTRIVDPEEVARQQILDSIRIAHALADLEGPRWMDLGSGTGYPGIPLAILHPGRSMTLCESVGKKARFLEETARAVGLADVLVRAERGERVLSSDPHDVVVARAVGSIAKLLSILHPVRRTFRWLAIAKGPRLSEEMEEARSYFRGEGPYRVADLRSYDIGGGFLRRFVLLVQPQFSAGTKRGPRRDRRGPRRS